MHRTRNTTSLFLSQMLTLEVTALIERKNGKASYELTVLFLNTLRSLNEDLSSCESEEIGIEDISSNIKMYGQTFYDLGGDGLMALVVNYLCTYPSSLSLLNSKWSELLPA